MCRKFPARKVAAADARRYHPGRSDPEDSPPSEARGRPAADCPCPCSPSNVRLGCLSLRRCAQACWRRARRGGVSHPVERVESPVQSVPSPCSGACPDRAPPRAAGLQATTAGRQGGTPVPEVRGAGVAPGPGAKMPLVFPIRCGCGLWTTIAIRALISPVTRILNTRTLLTRCRTYSIHVRRRKKTSLGGRR